MKPNKTTAEPVGWTTRRALEVLRNKAEHGKAWRARIYFGPADAEQDYVPLYAAPPTALHPVGYTIPEFQRNLDNHGVTAMTKTPRDGATVPLYTAPQPNAWRNVAVKLAREFREYAASHGSDNYTDHALTEFEDLQGKTEQ